ncbi:MAG: hypothetical protein M3371_00240 [Acidobacteriota bacterium]|nr:hypothetical protein [Acidobacteriota bacterium]
MRRPKQPIEGRPIAAKVLILLLLLCKFAAAQETAPISALEVKYRRQIFKNDRFSVFLLEIPPNHASLMHRHDTDILSIFVSGGETKGTIYGQPPREDRFAVGEVRFRPPGFTHSTENIGANVFRSVILEFNSSMGAIQPTKPPDSSYCNPGSETACVEEKYLFCTAKFCVKEVGIAPGAIWRDNEYASDQMLVGVSDYKLSYKPKGKAAHVRKRKSGEVEYFTGSSTRQWTNAASGPARIIAIVFR